jgi:hypothetical protein
MFFIACVHSNVLHYVASFFPKTLFYWLSIILQDFQLYLYIEWLFPISFYIALKPNCHRMDQLSQ